MASSIKTFATTHHRLLAAILLVLIACSAVAARHHRAGEAIVTADRVQVETSDYLVWHRQEAGSLEPDSLGASLRLFTTIADKLAADASGTGEFTTLVDHRTSSQSSPQRPVNR